jgi:hypothetical protein
VIHTAATGLSEAKTWVDIVGGVITAVAVLVGAAWAYFKFVAGRTFRPRLEVTLSGQWRVHGSEAVFHVRLNLKNIGASKVKLVQKGTGLRVSKLSTDAGVSPDARSWESIQIFEILIDHEWVEPAESVTDEHLLDLQLPDAQLLLLESRVVLKRRAPFKNIVVMSRRILPPDSVLDAPAEAANAS